jgi:hypothetical protein
MAEYQKQRQAYEVELERNFRAEPINESWASVATPIVQNTLDSKDEVRKSRRVTECRSKTCRTELSNLNVHRALRELHLMGQQFSQMFPVTRVSYPEGPNGHTIVLYHSSE